MTNSMAVTTLWMIQLINTYYITVCEWHNSYVGPEDENLSYTTWPKVKLFKHLIPKSWILIWSWHSFASITTSTLLRRISTKLKKKLPELHQEHKIPPSVRRLSRRWTRQDCEKVLFTDESLFCLTRDDGQICIYHQRNERYTKACHRERDRLGGGGSVVVWGGGSQHHRTKLVVIGVTGKTSSSLMWYPSCGLILTWPSSMTMPPAILLILCVISCKTGLSVF